MLLAVVVSLAIVAPGLDEALVVTKDIVLDPSKTYGAIVVKASGVTIDGNGTTLTGPGGKSTKDFQGVGISAQGVDNVTIKSLRVKGWETGLHVKDGKGWTVEGCNFSDNFHDPEFGWGEQGRRGGIVLERVSGSTLTKNKANRVWDACVLVDSNENTLVDNDFSRTSNTCLKLWNASRNTLTGNNLSYGLRIKEGEVHARDSAGLLIESGSNDNTFTKNDCTHGGDGVFIRVLNGWVSTGNVFIENDASYANNNGFEAWSPRNVYRGNKANHCSYGFWLGASDGTVLMGNEANFNGDPKGFHNSPHLPDKGHAGIVFMFGPSSHTIALNNTCKHNNGAGIALIGDEGSKGKAWKAYHWILENNTLTDNRWGIYARYADWLDLSGNIFANNAKADFSRDETVTNVFERPASPSTLDRPTALLHAPSAAKVGETVTMSAARSPRATGFRWDLGDGTTAAGDSVSHTYARPGFYRVGVTATNGHAADLAYRDLYVVEDRDELGTKANAWSWSDPASKVAFTVDPDTKLAGESSIRAEVNPYGGGRVGLVCEPGEITNLTGKTSIAFWIKAVNPNMPAWQGPNPIVTLTSGDGTRVVLTPKKDLLAQPPYNEAREGWVLIVVPLQGDATWLREGGEFLGLKSITIGLDSWGGESLRIWIDGLAVR